MVRRRARPAKEPALMVVTVTSNGVAAVNDEPLTTESFNGEPMNAVAVTVQAATNNNLLDDQYFASPKRKDCRLMKTNDNENLKAVHNPHNYSKDNNSKDTGRTIGKSFLLFFFFLNFEVNAGFSLGHNMTLLSMTQVTDSSVLAQIAVLNVNRCSCNRQIFVNIIQNTRNHNM